ncbi:MAG: hypothetical protein ACFBSG_16675 [Leptolyngbyaceae cyanobacterium]
MTMGEILRDQIGFVAKVLGLAAIISVLLKTVGPRLPLPPTAAVSLVIISLPSLVVGAILLWQLWTANDRSPHPPND